jgi:hypothetical protein
MGLISGIRFIGYSMKKSKFIRQVSVILGDNSSITSVENLMQQGDKKKAAENTMYEFCLNDPLLSQVIQKYNATKIDLENIYRILIAQGAGQWIKGNYVPVSSLLFQHSLDYLLEKIKTSKIGPEEAYRVLMYFEKGETGPILNG